MPDSARITNEEKARMAKLNKVQSKAKSGEPTSGELSLDETETIPDQKGNQLKANIKGAVELKSSRVTPKRSYLKDLGMKAALAASALGAAPQNTVQNTTYEEPVGIAREVPERTPKTESLRKKIDLPESQQPEDPLNEDLDTESGLPKDLTQQLIKEIKERVKKKKQSDSPKTEDSEETSPQQEEEEQEEQEKEEEEEEQEKEEEEEEDQDEKDSEEEEQKDAETEKEKQSKEGLDEKKAVEDKKKKEAERKKERDKQLEEDQAREEEAEARENAIKNKPGAIQLYNRIRFRKKLKRIKDLEKKLNRKRKALNKKKATLDRKLTKEQVKFSLLSAKWVTLAGLTILVIVVSIFCAIIIIGIPVSLFLVLTILPQLASQLASTSAEIGISTAKLAKLYEEKAKLMAQIMVLIKKIKKLANMRRKLLNKPIVDIKGALKNRTQKQN